VVPGRRKRAQYHWDKRKRRYIKLQPGAVVKAGKVRNESGKRVVSSDTGSYLRWEKQTHQSIPTAGTSETTQRRRSSDENDVGGQQTAKGRGRGRGGGRGRGQDRTHRGSSRGGQRKVKTELKSYEQLRKAKQMEAKKGLRQRGGGRRGKATKRK